MVAEELRELIDAHNEWLLVREAGRSFPLLRSEIEIDGDGVRTLIGFPDDGGFHSWRINGFESQGSEIAVDAAGAFGRKQEILRLIPRTAAASLIAEIELARLQKANEVGRLIHDNFVGVKLERVALNEANGRIAQILFSREKNSFAAMADVTGSLTPESMIATAMLWYEKIGHRKKKPVLDVWIVAEKRRSKELQKLHALLSERWRSVITILEISRRSEPPNLTELPKRKIRDLWRERARKLVLPADSRPSRTAAGITALAPGKIDIIYTRQGETLRYLGLPFARIRSMVGSEKAWFGVGKATQILTVETYRHLTELLRLIELHRSPQPPNKRHELYRIASEAWLESILSRNIKLLDANLILAPLYNQFRSSNDKIDLLALRKDGRLVIIELKTQPDREMVLQAADYWRKIELQRRRGLLAEANLFNGMEIVDRPALVYLAAPALSFHRDHEFFAAAVAPEIEMWRFEIHEKWRTSVRVIGRIGPE
ncbi:MAG: hypothetical protein ABJA02_13145 [Acidobacteriota bacterium]